MKFVVFLGLLVSSLAFAAGSYCPGLPDQVWLKTPTESFTHEYDVAVREGKLWIKSEKETSGHREEWRQLNSTGLPASSGFFSKIFGGWDSPPSIREISADGKNLIAVSDEVYIYYMKFGSEKWTYKWGKPIAKPLRLPENNGWSIAHRGPLAGGYEDVQGNFHGVSAGVSSLYVVSADGLKISYVDPWLPPKFNHYLESPQRGRFKTVALSVSGSTLFVVNAAGEMFTRLADYDTVGDDPVLFYTYKPAKKGSKLRALPGETWQPQPLIPTGGQITKSITIFQTGRGNAARELRVEGLRADGKSGFFHKKINDAAWDFTVTNASIEGSFLNPVLTGTETVLGPSLDHDCVSTGEQSAVLKDFNAVGSPATLVLGAETYTLYTRRIRGETTIKMRGMLVGGGRYIDVNVTLEGDVVKIEERGLLPWGKLSLELTRSTP